MTDEKTEQITNERLKGIIKSYDTVNILKLADMEVGEHIVAEILDEPNIVYFYDNKVVPKEDYFEKKQELEMCDDEDEKKKEEEKFGTSGQFKLKFHGRRYNVEDFEFNMNTSSGCATRFLKNNVNKEEYVGKFIIAKKTKYGKGFPQHVNVIKKEGFSLDKEPATKPFQPRQNQSCEQNNFNPETFVLKDTDTLVKEYIKGTTAEERSLDNFIGVVCTSQFKALKNQLIDVWNENFEQKEKEVSPQDKVLKCIKENDSENGCMWDLIIEKCKLKVDIVENIVTELLEKGEIFEVKPGRYKVLE